MPVAPSDFRAARLRLQCVGSRTGWTCRRGRCERRRIKLDVWNLGRVLLDIQLTLQQAAELLQDAIIAPGSAEIIESGTVILVPGIYQLACVSCDYSVRGVMSITQVLMDDGSEEICPHPGEWWTAEEATGKSWSELVQADRLIYRYALVCLACGKLDYYGGRDRSVDDQAGGHNWEITHHPSRSEAAAHSCKTCGARQCYPLCGQTGCLLGLLQLFGLLREKVVCQKCRKGLLRSKMVAIS